VKVNDLVIRFAGLQRSGNHAVISWIAEQFKGRRVLFLNNVGHDDVDPTVTTGIVTRYGYADGDQENEADVLIFSHEDDPKRMPPDVGFLASVYGAPLDPARWWRLGPGVRTLDLLLLRDPFNYAASRWKRLADRGRTEELNRALAAWKEVAMRVVEGRETPQFVSFNRWFADRDYRQELSRRLGGTFSDASLRAVSGVGKGSSFDGTAYDRSSLLRSFARRWWKLFWPGTWTRLGMHVRRLRGARGMKVLERWRGVVEEPVFRSALADPELADLSLRIFGEIPGVRKALLDS
jgi:hypothetical protein